MNLYSFVLITRHNFLSTYRIIALKEFWSFLTLYKVFISTLRLDRTVCLFSSYLLGRTQTTETGPQVSSRVSINYCGVPQGSVLGLILFCLYIKLYNKGIIYEMLELQGERCHSLFIRYVM